jgi:signal transduction histidine kinase
MTFRGRVLVAGAALALAPLAILAIGVRREARARLTEQYRRQGEAVVARAHDGLRRERDGVTQRLARLRAALADDNRFRIALHDTAARAYVLEYAGRAMRLAGLDLLQIHDADGRILSSGQFRNDFDRVDSTTGRALAAAGGPVLLGSRTADGPFLALAGFDSLTVAGRTLTIVGGRAVDSAFLAGLGGDSVVAVRLHAPADVVAPAVEPARAVVTELRLPFVGADGTLGDARLVAAVSLEPLRAVVRGLDRWFLAAAVVLAAGALALAAWLAARLTRPLTDLAEKTAGVDLDRLDQDFATDRDDEVGALSRLLESMTRRLRIGATRLRETERRLAVGELARQVNHDVKNGLVPLRHVVRHLADVARDEPARLAAVFQERRATLESGLTYLESLAASYARLTPRYEHAACDVNAVVRDVTSGVTAPAGVRLDLSLGADLPPVRGDTVMLRRIIENLVENAMESLGDEAGSVSVTTAAGNGGDPAVVLTVRDSGPGMTRAQLDRAFEDFYTTKPGGTGLGLSIVRRLVLDLDGALRVETAPGQGAAFRVELPAA